MPIDFTLTPEQKGIQAAAREFAQQVLKPAVRAADAEPDPQKGFRMMKPIYELAYEHGLVTGGFPREYGGGGMSNLDLQIAFEEICAVDCGFAFIVGVGSGLAIPRTISSFILKQIEDTVRPLLSLAGADGVTFSMNLLNPASNLNAIIILIGVSSVLFYFFFSIEHSGPGKVVARTGVLFLMIAFGAAFGYTVMARMSLLIGRLTDLIEFSDASYGSPTLWLALLTIAVLVVLSRRRQQEEPPEAH